MNRMKRNKKKKLLEGNIKKKAPTIYYFFP